MKPLTIKDKLQVILVMILSAMLSFTVVIDLMQGSSKNYFILEFILVLFLSALSQSRQFGINGIVLFMLRLDLLGFNYFFIVSTSWHIQNCFVFLYGNCCAWADYNLS